MGFFKSKKKVVAASSPSPLPLTTAVLATASPLIPSSPIISAPPQRPLLRLRVIIHPAPTGMSSLNEAFWISVDPEESVESIRQVISDRLGGIAMGIFKVAVPWDAFEQATEYARRYKDPVDLITHFPAYSLDDPIQLRHSLGPAGWQMQLPATLRIKDWWPFPLLNDDLISIIARPITHASTSIRPLTLLAHFAPPERSGAYHTSGSSATGTPTSKPIRRPPTPVDVLPTSTIAQLKAALLHADGRSVEKLDKVILWRVEMSEEEMVVIEERGGLKSGQMPWPYPPTAEVPIALSNDALPVSHYFPDTHSNTRIVSLSVWIHPSASLTLARISPADALDAPTFKYPMSFPPELRRASASHSLPTTSPALDAEIVMTANTLPSRVAGRARRGRPSTAPAACDVVGGDLAAPPNFGGMRSLRGRSPLASTPAPAPTHQTDVKGLGLGIAGSDLPPISANPSEEITLDMTKLSLKVNMGESISSLVAPGTEAEGGKIIWQPAVGSLRQSETQSKGIRSLAGNRSLRAYEIC